MAIGSRQSTEDRDTETTEFNDSPKKIGSYLSILARFETEGTPKLCNQAHLDGRENSDNQARQENITCSPVVFEAIATVLFSQADERGASTGEDDRSC